MAHDRLMGIFRTGGVEPACGAQDRGQRELIRPDERLQHNL
jgi:hypothetical protein